MILGAPATMGAASGWSVTPRPYGGFDWSAFGPRGSERGDAQSQACATVFAREAYERLRRPVLSVVQEA